ncbi:MAG: three-Cys-motif partner protein TcmP, partial [candidate division Zixibacteria bacterium]|nr:three-Cys-motif partner protein TcmP [candidate division Zixibacteria bacterium]
MAQMNTENTFFEGKRPWSKIKDAVLRDYLPAYLSKVATLSQRRIILIDAFAGPGIFENEVGMDRLGSPLIILHNAEKYVPGKYLAIFVNSKKDHHKKLSETIKEYRLAKTLFGNAQELLKEIKSVLTNQTLFIYLDPFGLKDLDFDLIKPFLERDISYSTEILVNMSMPTLHRLATRKLKENGIETEKSIIFNQILTKVLGGEYWKEIMWNASLSAEEKEIRVMEKYREILREYLPYAGSCPVSEKKGRRVKYFITFCSRHNHAMLLMNDAMCKAYFKYMHEREYKNTLFEDVDWKKVRDLNPLKKVIIDELKMVGRESRQGLWERIIQKLFMQFHSSEYKEAVKQLALNEDKIKYKNPKNTGRLNDECILFLNNRGNNSNTNTGLLIKERIIDYPQAKSKVYDNRLSVHFNRYETIDGKTKVLVSRINDGSIITRFDKTPLPEKTTDVICPHFIELKWAYGCPFDCSWCYLKGTFRFRPEGIKPVIKDLEKVKLHVQTFLDEVKEPEILNTGELADSLMMENGSNAFSKFIIPLFESQNRHKVLFVTKSNNVK